MSMVLALGLMLAGCGQPPEEPAAGPAAAAVEADTLDLPQTNYYAVETPHGRMVVRLYDETPVHRDNFKRLVEEGFYDGTTFHRIIEGFMIQGGDPNSRDDDPGNDGEGGPGYTLPAEIYPYLYHKRGALAAARQGDPVNPERRSSGSQFYIAQGQPLDSLRLDRVEQQIRMATQNPDFRFTERMREAYTTEGGAPFLDRQYTVFGEVVEGLDVLDRIAAAETPRRLGQPAPPQAADRPTEPIPMTVRPLPDYEE